MASVKLSVIIVAKNEEKDIEDCLKSVQWAKEIIFVDTGSTDKTLSIARRYSVKITNYSFKKFEYDTWRNIGLKAASGEWVLYLDADERITPELKKEIQKTLLAAKFNAYMIPRRNFLLGKELHWGGWWPGYVKRLFRKNSLKGWINHLHEEPVFEGEFGYLKEPMIHLQPETIEPMLKKSIEWSKLEAKMLYNSQHPPVVWWRVLRMGLTTLFERMFRKQGFRDGVEGMIESCYQAFHTMIVYVQLWEMQCQNQKSPPKAGPPQAEKIKN